MKLFDGDDLQIFDEVTAKNRQAIVSAGYKLRGRDMGRYGKAWLAYVFRSGQVVRGNINRRSMDSVARFASPEALEAEVKRRGFHMVMMGDHYVILCRRDGPIKVIC
jgi:hypothetical protein